MPTWRQQCECGLRFEHHGKMADLDVPVPCPDCKAPATRRLPPTGVSSSLDLEIRGLGPQSTGTALDHDLDRIIGRAAEHGWAVQGARTADKRAVLRANPGTAPSDLTQNPDGSWGILPKGAGAALQGISQAVAAGAPADESVPSDPDAPREAGWHI